MFLIVGCVVFICASGKALSNTTEAPHQQFSTTAMDTSPSVNSTDSDSRRSGSNSTCDCWSRTYRMPRDDLQNSTDRMFMKFLEECPQCQNSSFVTTEMPTVLPSGVTDLTTPSKPPLSTTGPPSFSNGPFIAVKDHLPATTSPVSAAETTSYGNTVANSSEGVFGTASTAGAFTDDQDTAMTLEDHMDWTDTEDPLATTHQPNAFSSPVGALKSTAVPTTSHLQFMTSTVARTSSVHIKQPTAKGVDVISVDIEDYNYYEEDTSVKAGRMANSPIQKCNYDPCTHLQKPCTEMFDNCLCPGQSPASDPPGTPPMSLGEVTHNSVQVLWCAPSSHVEQYLLQVEQVEGGFPMTQRVNSMFRRSTVFSLLGGQQYNICLTAENQAGSSQPTCVAFSTSVNNKPYLYTLAGLAGLLAVVTMVLSIFLYKQCKKPPLASPHLTSLISIPNPAFCSPEERLGSSTNIFRI